jgi:hypothetical protein
LHLQLLLAESLRLVQMLLGVVCCVFMYSI